MSERCRRCDREDCAWPEAYRLWASHYQNPLPGEQEAELAAEADCLSHEVNWRDEALKARSEVERLTTILSVQPLRASDVVAAEAKRDAATARAARAETALADASRVCDKLGCIAAVVRKDDGSRVCAAGHRSRWYDAEDFERVRDARDYFEAGYALSSGERDVAEAALAKMIDEVTEQAAFLERVLTATPFPPAGILRSNARALAGRLRSIAARAKETP